MIDIVTTKNIQPSETRNYFRYLSLLVQGSSIHLSVCTVRNSDSEDGQDYGCIEADIALEKSKCIPNKLNLVLTDNPSEIEQQWMSDICEDKIGDYFLKFRSQSVNSKVRSTLLSIFFDNSGKITLIPRFPFVLEEGSSFNKLDLEDDSEESLCTYIDGYSDFQIRQNAKLELVSSINVLDCLASLEAQLDMLSDIVLNGVDKSGLQQVLSKSSVRTLHSNEKLLQTIERNKEHLRAIQSQYFMMKGPCVSTREGA